LSELQVCPAEFNRNVLVDDEASIRQTLFESVSYSIIVLSIIQEPNYWHARRSLRPRYTRPKRRAAESSHEFAPSKANAHLHLPRLPRTGSRLRGEGLRP
jgi:hypothetical protein